MLSCASSTVTQVSIHYPSSTGFREMRSTERRLATGKPMLSGLEPHKGGDNSITTRRGKYASDNPIHSRATRKNSEEFNDNVPNETGVLDNESDAQLGGSEESEEDKRDTLHGEDLAVRPNQRSAITLALWQQFEKLYKSRGTQKELHEWKERHKNEKCVRCTRLDFLCTKTANDGKIVCKECLSTIGKHCSRMDDFRKERMSKKMDISNDLWEEMNRQHLKRNHKEPLIREEGDVVSAESGTEKEDPELDIQREDKTGSLRGHVSSKVTQKEALSASSTSAPKGHQKRKWFAQCEDETSSSPVTKRGKTLPTRGNLEFMIEERVADREKNGDKYRPTRTADGKGSELQHAGADRHAHTNSSDDPMDEKFWRRNSKRKEQDMRAIFLTPQGVDLPIAASSNISTATPQLKAPLSSVSATPKAAGARPDITPLSTESGVFASMSSSLVQREENENTVNPVDVSVAPSPAPGEGFLAVASPALSAQHLQQLHVHRLSTEPTAVFSAASLDSSFSLAVIKRQLEDVSSDLRYNRIDVASAMMKLDDVAARLGRYPPRRY
ncbi:hypothetical protein PM082_012403 [Marasmius tenuissimus]|nr:hypothetical protein PM082_012403 [Marasmius tenuissimus]